MDEIRRLTTYLFDRCPKMDHHNLAMIRGDRKNPSLQGPSLEQYQKALRIRPEALGVPGEGRYGSVVEPMLQWAKSSTAAAQRQVVPCRAGILNAVVYSNGDVSVCENHAPLGNLREKSFPEIWNSDRGRTLLRKIDRRQGVLLHQRSLPLAQSSSFNRSSSCAAW